MCSRMFFVAANKGWGLVCFGLSCVSLLCYIDVNSNVMVTFIQTCESS